MSTYTITFSVLSVLKANIAKAISLLVRITMLDVNTYILKWTLIMHMYILNPIY